MAGNKQNLKYKNVFSGDGKGRKEGKEEDIGNYLGRSLEKLNLGSGPRKKLLVLSLNGLIIYKVHQDNDELIPKNRRPDAQYLKYFVYKRPFLDEFMRFCFKRFEVGIWSSAIDVFLIAYAHSIIDTKNISGVLNCGMRGMEDKLIFIWDQQQCTDTGVASLENARKSIYLKELKKIWEGKKNSKLLGVSRQYSSSNTLLFDDKPYKALLNPPNTGIFLESYKGDTKDTTLGPKSELRRYLEALADADDVPSYVKQHPFGKPAITASHADWDYYSQVLRHIGQE